MVSKGETWIDKKNGYRLEVLDFKEGDWILLQLGQLEYKWDWDSFFDAFRKEADDAVQERQAETVHPHKGEPG